MKCIELLLLTAMLSCAKGNNVYRIHYLPLDIQLYGAPDIQYIKKHGEAFTMQSKQLDSLFQLLEGSYADGEASDDTLGLRIIIHRLSDSLEVYVTAERKILYKKDDAFASLEVNSSLVEDIVNEIVANAPSSAVRKRSKIRSRK